MKKNWVKEYFSIPNLLGYFRLILIPVYLYLYLNAKTPADYYTAAAVMLLSFLTDFFDGKIARRFNMITDFGKILDPIADKLSQAALVFSLTFRYPILMALMTVFIIKEFTLGILGLYMMKQGFKMDGAQMHGKICTAVLDLSMFIMLLFPSIPYGFINTLVGLCLIVMAVSLFLYLQMYYRAWSEKCRVE